MSYRESIKPYLQFLHAMGLAPYQAEYEVNANKFARSDITNIGWFSLCLFLIGDVIAENLKVSQLTFTKTNDLLYYIGLFLEFVRATAVFMQYMTCKQTLYDINYGFQEIKSCFNAQLQHRVPYRSFRRRLILKSLIIFLAYFQYLVGHIIRNIYGYVGSQMRVLQALTVLTYIHILLYIEALSHHLDQINVVIKNDTPPCAIFCPSKRTNIVELRNRLKTVKYIHFRLWLVAQDINRAFGWILVVLTLYTFTDVLVGAFWCYEEVRNGGDFMTSLSKSK